MSCMSCMNCEDLLTKECGQCGLFRTSSAVQYRKVKDERCTKELKKYDTKKEVAKWIYKTIQGMFRVEIKGRFAGEYMDMIQATQQRNKYMEEWNLE